MNNYFLTNLIIFAIHRNPEKSWVFGYELGIRYGT